MLQAIYFIFGLIIGSFLNAVIWRLHSGKSISDGRSICPKCKHELSALDLVPLFSYVFLGGKCRYCHKKISWQYPVVELATALSFMFLAGNFQSFLSPVLVFQLVFVSFFIVIAVFDLQHYLILDKVVFPAAIIALMYRFYLSSRAGDFGWHSSLMAGLAGAAIISGFFGLQYVISSGRWIGLGDVKLGIFLGLVFGVGQGLLLLFLAYCTGAVVGLALVAASKKELSGKLPFGTFLCFSATITLLNGPAILAWYLRLIGL